MAQVQIRNRGDNQCPHHVTEIVVLACINCDGELVCAKCITTRHRNHEFENISKVAYKKKTYIQEYVQRVEKTELPTILNNLQSIDNQIEENTNHFKNLQKEIRLQGEKVKEEVDNITRELMEKCETIERQNSELLYKYKRDLEYLYSQLNETIDECKDALKADNVVMIIDIEKDTQEESEFPNSPKCKTVEFTAGSRSIIHLQDYLGSLSVEEIQEPHHALKSDIVKQYRFNDSTVVSEFTHSNVITSVEKSTSDSLWLSHCDKYISLATLQGEVKCELVLCSYVEDISVSPVTGNLWLCCNDKVVYEALGNKLIIHFTTDYHPCCLCMTPDNSAVVDTDDCNVTVYSITGEVLHSTQGSGSVASPHRISVCTSTGDIAVCDSDMLDYGGGNKPHVSVFNSKLDLKYQYYGPPVSVMKSDFWPNDVAYDTQGHLLITDDNNKCIQMVSDEGQFLTVVHTDTLQPTVLTLIQDGLLCVGFADKKIKVIRYTV